MKNLFKSLFYSVVLGLAVMVSFTSCDKDEEVDPVAAEKALLMGKTWEITSFTSEKNSATFEGIMAMASSMIQFEYTFSKANVYTLSLVSFGIPTPMTGKWSMSDDAKTLTLDGQVATIDKLTATELQLTVNQEYFDSMEINSGTTLETGRITMVMKVK